MNAERKIRVGVIGVGKMGLYHLQKYMCLPEVEVVGCLEPNADRRKVLEQEYPVRFFDDLSELLFEVDAVTIASPTATHYAFGRRALDAGVHVLIEKPMTSTVPEAEELVALARQKNLTLQVGMVERFRLKALAKEVPLRPVFFIETHRLSKHLSRENSVGVVLDLMIHDLDLALSLVDEDPVHVSAIGMNVLTAQDDLANVRLEFPSGAVMNLNVSRVSADPVRKLRVFSANAYASFDFLQNRTTIFRKEADKGVERIVNESPAFDPLLEQVRDFIDCVKHGKRPLVAGEDGLRALRFAQIVVQKISERGMILQGATVKGACFDSADSYRRW